MIRKVFFSFHFDNDNWRAGQIRNMGIVEDEKSLHGNKWEDVKSKSESTIKTWIENNLKDKSCLIVLIGEKTSQREWVKYEIKRAWELGKAVCGIYVHNLEDRYGNQSQKGSNPLNINIPVFEPPSMFSKIVYDDIKNNMEDLVENAIAVRSRFQ